MSKKTKPLRIKVKKSKAGVMKDLLNYVEYFTGKSGSKIAEELGMSRQSYNQLKNKKPTIREKLIIQICDKYKIPEVQVVECLRKDLANKKAK